MMRRILILDTETTGLDPATCVVVEVAAILYSVECATVIRSFSSLLRAGANEAEAINRIPSAALAAEAPMAEWVWPVVDEMTSHADAIVAHNADFDRAFVPPSVRDAVPWVCSKNDLTWPKQTAASMSLVALTLAHDLGVATAHRAMADCDLLARLFTRARELGADLDAMLARGMRPKAKFVAMVSYEDREKAKAAGFQWEPTVKTWWRSMAIEDAAALPFKVRQMTG